MVGCLRVCEGEGLTTDQYIVRVLGGGLRVGDGGVVQHYFPPTQH
jgi:hypothetical protein